MSCNFALSMNFYANIKLPLKTKKSVTFVQGVTMNNLSIAYSVGSSKEPLVTSMSAKAESARDFS